MNNEIKCFETKSIAGYSFYDYWDLKSHHLFIAFRKSDKPFYLHIEEEQFEYAHEVSNLTDIRNALYKNEWAFEEKYWKVICERIQNIISIPFT